MKTLCMLVVCMSLFLCMHAQIDAPAQEKFSRISISNPNPHTLTLLQQSGIDLHCGGHMHVVDGLPTLELECSSKELTFLKAKAISYEVVVEDIALYYAQRGNQHLNRAKELLDRQKAESGVHRSTRTGTENVPRHFQLGEMAGFLYYDQILSVLDTMALLYPELISSRTLVSDTIRTRQGREVFWVKISDYPNADEEEPEVLYTGLTHAREPASTMSMLYYMWYLLENYAHDPEAKRIIDHTELYFIPVVNPDGYIFNQTNAPQGGGMWRKNMQDNDYNSVIDDEDGVDLNRNYGYLWGFDNLGSSADPSKSTYRGTEPFSEPETQMVREFVNQRHFTTAMHDHTYGTDLYHAWEHGPELLPDAEAFYRLSDLMAWDNRYLFGETYSTYWLGEINGGANDWFYGEQSEKPKVYTWLAEIGMEFWPDPLDIVTICQEQLKPHLMVAKAAGQQAMIHDLNTGTLRPGLNKLSFRIENLGFGNGNFTLHGTPISSSILDLRIDEAAIAFENISEAREVAIDLYLDSRVLPDEEIFFEVVLNGEQYEVHRLMCKGTIDPVETSFADEVMLYWESQSWGVVPDSDNPSLQWLTDSPGGNQLNAFNIITLKESIDLSEVSWAHACFKAKWAVETANDFVQLQARIDQGNWIPLTGRYTKAGVYGNEMVIPSAYASQPEGEPLYDGRQKVWITEIADLSTFVGSNNIQLRFVAWSGGYLSPVEEDGFYFADFRICTSRKVHCSDMQLNADETDVDCGGADCAVCPTCSDGIWNGDETAQDCGGSDCAPCASCEDGIQNNDEEGIDCGGTHCDPCATCVDGIQNGDEDGIDCGGECSPCPTCTDGIQNGDETGIDCGGQCNGCAPTCDDGILNGDEEDVDCGGSCPSICKTICCDDINKIYYSDNLQVLIKPNPVRDVLILNIEYDETQEDEFEILSAEILTATGISVWKEQMSSSKEILVDVSSFQEGFYVLRVQDENDGICIRRFIRH